MYELPRSDQYCVQYFLHLGVSCFGLGQNLADEIDRSLDFLDVPLLRSFDDKSSTDHVVCSSDVEQ